MNAITRLKSQFKIGLFAAFLAMAALTTIGTVVYHQLKAWNWTTASYFSMITFSAFGYRSFYPSVAIAFAPLGAIGTTYLKLDGEGLFRKEKKPKL